MNDDNTGATVMTDVMITVYNDAVTAAINDNDVDASMAIGVVLAILHSNCTLIRVRLYHNGPYHHL